jgi:hypothetical protein
MTDILTEQVMQLIRQVAGNYYRLIFVVGSAGAGKTTVLKEVAALSNVSVWNVNLELSRRMLELTERQRCIQTPQLLNEILDTANSELVILDNIEILFDPTLKQDPLRLLQAVARNKPLVVAWNGSSNGEHLEYAKPEHPEYKRYPIRDFFVVTTERNNRHDETSKSEGLTK